MTAATPTRRCLQFSLRTLFVFVTLCAVACSWLAVKMKEAERQRKAVEEIEKLGGTVLYDWKLDAEGHLRPNATPAGPQRLRNLLGNDFFWKVKAVELFGPQVTDSVIQHLKGLSELDGLQLDDTKVTDSGLENLKGLSQLQSLSLKNAKVTDSGLQHLKGLSQLHVLWLDGTKVTDSGLENLKGLSRLLRLSLDGTRVTDEGEDKLKEALPQCKIER